PTLFPYTTLFRSPIGTATNVAIAVILSVPKINAHIPYCGVEENGFHSLVNKNSVIGTRVKNVIVSVNNVTIIPTVANIEKIAMTPKIIGTILSLIPFFLALYFIVILINHFTNRDFLISHFNTILSYRLPILKQRLGLFFILNIRGISLDD